MEPITMHLYECTECGCKFGVEDSDEVDHSATSCPMCTDLEMYEIGYGKVEFIA